MLSVLRRLSVVLTRFMGVIIIAFSALALWQPWIFSWVAPHISAMLGIIMLGMGMTLHWQDFSHVLRHPRDLGLGLVVQFGCMPLLAFALCHVFALPPELAMGMILVGTAPGGTASNVLTFIARGDVAFSVAMTAAATLVSLLLTPPLTWLLGGVWVPVDMGGLFWSRSCWCPCCWGCCCTISSAAWWTGSCPSCRWPRPWSSLWSSPASSPSMRRTSFRPGPPSSRRSSPTTSLAWPWAGSPPAGCALRRRAAAPWP